MPNWSSYGAFRVKTPVQSVCTMSPEVGLPVMTNFAVPGSIAAKSLSLVCTVTTPAALAVTVPNANGAPVGFGVGGTICATRLTQADRLIAEPVGPRMIGLAAEI